MKSSLKLFAFILLLPFNSMAQGFYPGYAVKNNGDTLKGYIRYKQWEYNPRSIQFKPEVDGKEQKLSTNDTKYFSIDIGYPLDFQKYQGAISINDIDIDRMTTFRDTGYRMDTVFLKIVRKGNVTLFSYDDKIKTRFFVADGPDDVPVELIFRNYFKDNGKGSNRTVNEDIYKTQLKKLAEKYGKLDESLTADIRIANYSDGSIIHIINKINGQADNDNPEKTVAAGAPKIKLVLMGAVVAVIAILVFSVMHH